jgi:hypothetical protein
LDLSYPFDPHHLMDAVYTLDTLYTLKMELPDFCPGAEFSAYLLGSLVQDRMIKPYVELAPGPGLTVQKLGFADAKDEMAPLLAVYQRKGSIRFDLKPDRFPELMNHDGIWATSRDARRARVACRADDEELVYELLNEVLIDRHRISVSG